MSQIKTYPEMNETIKDLLLRSEEPMQLYILTRIEELEKQVSDLIPPPNAPLTLEQLWEMDGEPVWWEDKYGRTGYGIVFISEFDKVIYIVAANRTFVAIAHGEMNKHLGLTLFRRKPEEGTTWQ